MLSSVLGVEVTIYIYIYKKHTTILLPTGKSRVSPRRVSSKGHGTEMLDNGLGKENSLFDA